MAKKDAMKVITDTIDEAKKKAEPVIEEAKKKAEPVIEEAKKKAEPVIEGAKKKAEPVIEGAKKKAEPMLEGAKKKAEPMLEEAKKKAEPVIEGAKKRAKKTTKSVADAFSEATAKSEIFIQYGDYEIKTEDMVKRVREAYVAEGHKSADIREVQIYIKPSDNCAYYVINHRDTGKVEF